MVPIYVAINCVVRTQGDSTNKPGSKNDGSVDPRGRPQPFANGEPADDRKDHTADDHNRPLHQSCGLDRLSRKPKLPAGLHQQDLPRRSEVLAVLVVEDRASLGQACGEISREGPPNARCDLLETDGGVHLTPTSYILVIY
jgi:hypothetical protein